VVSLRKFRSVSGPTPCGYQPFRYRVESGPPSVSDGVPTRPAPRGTTRVVGRVCRWPRPRTGRSTVMVKDRSAAGAAEFRAARDLLLEHRLDQPTAHQLFTWPRTESFNWALDHFDEVAKTRPDRTALWIVGEQDENKYTYRHMSLRSNQVANWLYSQGVHPGDRILVLLGDQVELWELLLAVIKLGAVVSPAPPSLTESELVDRLDRGSISHVVCAASETEKFAYL